MSLPLGWLLVENDVDGIESQYRVTSSPLKYLRAGVDSHANGLEKLIQALRDAITLLKPELDAEFEFELLDDPTNSLSPHIDLPTVHPMPAVPKFSLLNVHKHDMQVPSPIHPTSSSHRSCPSPHLSFLRVKDRSTIRPIAFLWGRREQRLRSGRETMSPLLPSAVQYSTPGEKPFELAPSPLTPSFCKAKRTRRRSTCQSYPAPPIRRPTLVSSTSSPSCPRHLFFLFPSFPSCSYSHSYVPRRCHVARPQGCITVECVRDDRSSVFPFPLYEI